MTVKQLIIKLLEFDLSAIVTDGEEDEIITVIDNQGIPMIESNYKSKIINA